MSTTDHLHNDSSFLFGLSPSTTSSHPFLPLGGASGGGSSPHRRRPPQRLVDAAAQGNLSETLALWEEYGADLLTTSRDAQGWTALMQACSQGHAHVVQFLLSQSSSGQQQQQQEVVNARSDDAMGATALHYAVASPHARLIVPLLLDGGDVHVNATDGKHEASPLHWACQKACNDEDHHMRMSDNGDRLAIVQLLLQHPAIDIASVDGQGNSPLDLVLEQHELQKTTTDRGEEGDDNQDPHSPTTSTSTTEQLITLFENYMTEMEQDFTMDERKFWMALVEHNVAEVSHLIHTGMVNPNRHAWYPAQVYPQTPLYVACRYGWTTAVDCLVQHWEVDLNVSSHEPLDHPDGNQHADPTPLSDTNHNDSLYPHNWTPLHIASYHGHLSIVQRLLDHRDTQVGARTRQGETALDLAIRGCRSRWRAHRHHHSATTNNSSEESCVWNHPVVHYLWANGGGAPASGTSPTSGPTKMLMMNPPDPHTQFLAAAQHGFVSEMKYLWSQRLVWNLRVTYGNGQTAWHLASRHGHVPVLQFLVRDTYLSNNNHKNDHHKNEPTIGDTSLWSLTDYRGRTALHEACRWPGNIDVVAFWLRHMSTEQSQIMVNQQGQTAYQVAVDCGNTELVQVFHKHAQEFSAHSNHNQDLNNNNDHGVDPQPHRRWHETSTAETPPPGQRNFVPEIFPEVSPNHHGLEPEVSASSSSRRRGSCEPEVSNHQHHRDDFEKLQTQFDALQARHQTIMAGGHIRHVVHNQQDDEDEEVFTTEEEDPAFVEPRNLDHVPLETIEETASDMVSTTTDLVSTTDVVPGVTVSSTSSSSSSWETRLQTLEAQSPQWVHRDEFDQLHAKNKVLRICVESMDDRCRDMVSRSDLDEALSSSLSSLQQQQQKPRGGGVGGGRWSAAAAVAASGMIRLGGASYVRKEDFEALQLEKDALQARVEALENSGYNETLQARLRALEHAVRILQRQT